MRKVAWLSKIAFIFNIIYFIDLLLRFKIVANNLSQGPIGLLGGWLLAPVFNLALLFSLLLLKKKNEPLPVEKWIWVFCLCCLIFQTVLFLVYD
ncbi:hypothetical protein SAMN05192529_110124 [Arachidicoccus rhizosphaerae]|uniref:Uncharacterized protein n=1 Tax=Arachidicoccus rhizosphaerae TaxID=551991 RepID=A0A1H3ZAL5_9BACT|nr:hypothetical protein [Arachidicoccus rhizosphaerae]SEA20796.1 hypothetical protein SAMN05192529_110124 [Arachidicoccus rhizosphaerae]